MIYDAQPVAGIEVVSLGAIQIVPVFDKADLSNDAIDFFPGTRVIAGFNVAFEGEKITGIQGLFAEQDDEARDPGGLTSGHWLGKQTDNVKQIITSDTIHGFLFFLKGSEINGMTPIYKD